MLVTRARAAEAPIPSAPSRWVTDSFGFIDAATAKKLDLQLEAYERQTGHQVVVWIGASTGDTPLDDFAVRTFEKWKLGGRGLDDGLLVLVLARDRKIAIEVGYGLEDRVPDATASRIINDVMVPRLRANDANGALVAGVDAVLSAIEGKPFRPDPGASRPEAKPAPGPSTGQLVLYGLLALVFLIVLVTNPHLALNLLLIIGSRGLGGGGGGFGGGFSGGGGRSGGGGARGSW
jgi:uncharacterized protein